MKLEKLVHILFCPRCKGKLVIFEDTLTCSDCSRDYKILDGRVPDFIDNQQSSEILSNSSLVSREFYNKGLLDTLIKMGSRLITSEFRVNKSIYNRELANLKEDSVALEVGSGQRKLSPCFITLDLFPFEKVDIVCDAHSLPFNDDSVDFILIDAVLEHVKDPWKVAAECIRVLKAGGRILCVVPFIHHFHAFPNDYFRFTVSGIRSLFENGMNVKEATTYGGPTVALISTIAEYFSLYSFSKNNFINALIRAFVLLFIFPFKYLDYILIRNDMSVNICSTIVLVAEKNKPS